MLVYPERFNNLSWTDVHSWLQKMIHNLSIFSAIKKYTCSLDCKSHPLPFHLFLHHHPLTLVFDRGWGVEYTKVFLIYFLLKNSLLDHALRATCKFLILAIFYHAKKIPENWKVLLYWFMKWGEGLNLHSLPFLFVKTIEKVIKFCTVLIFFLSWYLV